MQADDQPELVYLPGSLFTVIGAQASRLRTHVRDMMTLFRNVAPYETFETCRRAHAPASRLMQVKSEESEVLGSLSGMLQQVQLGLDGPVDGWPEQVQRPLQTIYAVAQVETISVCERCWPSLGTHLWGCTLLTRGGLHSL
jgi:hypothetical protein